MGGGAPPPGSRARRADFGESGLKSDGVELKTGHPGRSRLPSPSRHIYKPLTIAVAFSGLLAFDRVWQPPIKVDGTFA
jgi:hypothetical protein